MLVLISLFVFRLIFKRRLLVILDKSLCGCGWVVRRSVWDIWYIFVRFFI